MKEKFSFIIPCYRSEKLVSKVINEIINTIEPLTGNYEIIAVNDSSPDNVLGVLKETALSNEKVKVIDLAKNMGKHAAVMAGLSYSTGDYICLLDDDGQCPMDRFWDLFQPLSEGHDIAIAKYTVRKESRFRNFGSRVNDKMSQILIGKPKDLQLSNFVVMKRFLADKILEYKNPYPYLDGLILSATSKIVNVSLENREREGGGSSYTLIKLLHQISNGFTAFSVKPLRIATFLGVLVSVLGFLFGIYIIVKKLIDPDVVAGYTSTIAILLFIGGMIMFLLGIIGEYIGRIYICINNSPQYVVRDTYNMNDVKGETNEKDRNNRS